ncbi:hypothetical protein RGUI_2489 [Rhodovulum sp. P5]|uniref:FeoA family protein n=1 Tax=Rhodovulum sp. P5 TaxID=1564506 RepID=UPI0009C2C44C|nr:FeoA family protein [Rhodovulum sp. P5]ARE40630.1 hypothetical protein RGUI_2489 [Rhodovulum sp. P5]
MGRGLFGGHGWGKGKGRHRHGQHRRCHAEDGTCAVCPQGGSLNDCAPGTTCRIRRLMGCGAVRQRLLDLGIRPYREVTVLRAAPLRDPIELRVGDSFIVLRRHEAAQIEVDYA